MLAYRPPIRLPPMIMTGPRHQSPVDSPAAEVWLFRLAAAFNYAVAASLLLPSPIHAAMGLPGPVHPLYLHLCAVLIAVFGFSYHLVARDPGRNHGIVVVGIVGKLLVFVLLCGHFLAGHIPLLPLMLGTGDLVFAALFVRFLLGRHRGS